MLASVFTARAQVLAQQGPQATGQRGAAPIGPIPGARGAVMRLPSRRFASRRSSPARSAGRSFYHQEFLQRQGTVVRPSLFPV